VGAVPPSVNSWSADYIDAQYACFQDDPASVPDDLRGFFQGFDLALARPAGWGAPVGGASPFQSVVDELINAYRESGHLCAKIDPFDRSRPRPASLELKHYGLGEADLNRRVEAHLGGVASPTLRDVIAHLEQTYCQSIGIEFMHIREGEEREWFLANYEQKRGMEVPPTADRMIVLEQLARAEIFETFCQTRYPTGKRFSLEGGVSTIPLLDALIERGATLGVEEMVFGMAHRGRLNVLNNILGKSYEQIFTEFEDNWEEGFADGGGDVKYHRGYSGIRKLRTGGQMPLAMASNPSHLESANAVVLGRCRAKQRVRGDKNRTRVIPLLIHGDAALPGQGVVAEGLNMMRLEGYTVGGTIHVVINNLIGFTTIPEDGRSTEYCTDIAKASELPVFHVNGEDPEACVAVARLAVEYRQKFKKDVFIDLVCYRKHGHNEQDEQSYTQPILAALIKARPSTLTVYTQRLLAAGVIDQAGADALAARLRATLDQAQEAAKKKPFDPTIDPGSARWKGITGKYSFTPAKTGVGADVLTEICDALGTAPEGFNINPKLKGLLQGRKDIPKTGQVNHADAELLAIGSLLAEGLPVRLSGQDSRRGTFTQRHAVLRDFNSGAPYIPLNNIHEMGEWATDHEPGTKATSGPHKGKTRQAQFCVWDSPLSEYSVMGFDYGYSLADPNMLVMWEAQFGDFCNGAQIMIDQYLAAGELKWSRWSGLVLLLPHGYEGAGPEHSSARMERFLLLCADDNMEVCYPSTGAQHFHMLRRQVKRSFRKPLIVMTPKSMLRVPTSTFNDLVSGRFFEVMDDPEFASNAGGKKSVSRVIFCSGKIFHEMNERRKQTGRKDIAIIRMEQLYPFHQAEVRRILDTYNPKAERVWVQEEPRNAGAYTYIADRFQECFDVRLPYIGRKAAATPAVGSKHAHEHEQDAILSEAIGSFNKSAAEAKPSANASAGSDSKSNTVNGSAHKPSPAPREIVPKGKSAPKR
jgi:2-oxoglutarate dehydrogenase E1 component